MKKILTLAMLCALPAFGQRSISVTTNGTAHPFSWGIQNGPTNLVWTGIHENRANTTNTAASSQRFDGGFIVSTVATQANARVTGWAHTVIETNTTAFWAAGWVNVIGNLTNVNQRSTGWTVTPVETNTTAFRAEGGFTVTTIATNANLRVSGTSLFSGATTNVAAGRFESTVDIVGALTLSAAVVFPDGIRQVFNPNGSFVGLNVGSHSVDPSSSFNGDIYYNTSSNVFKIFENSAWRLVGSGSGGSDATKLATNQGTAFAVAFRYSTNLTAEADLATNLTHATHNEFVMDGPRFARMSMGANMVLGFVPPSSSSSAAHGMIGRLRVLSTGGEITFSNISQRGPVPLNTGTNMFYFHWDGTNYWVEAGQNATTGGGSHYVLSNAPTILNAELTTPTIASFANSTHTHESAAGGGTLNAAAIAAGTVATARLGSGTANASTYLRGDQSWATIVGGSASFISTNIYVTNTSPFVLKLAEFDKFMVHLETNATLILSNASTLTKRAQIYYQQDTNGTRTVDLTVAGGLLQTNAVMQPTTNANALDLLEIMPGFFDTNLVAWWPQNFQPRIAFTNSLAGGAAECSTSDTPLDHDQLLEGWQNTGAENTWNSWVGTETVTFDANFDTSALTTGKDTGQCDRGVQVTVGTAAGDESLYWNRGSAVTIASNPTRFTFNIYVTTAPDAGENFTIAAINTTTTGSGSVNTWINLRNNGGTLEVQAEGNSSSAWNALTANSWNTIVIDLAATAANSTITVNGGTPATYTYLGTTWQYFHYGAVQNHALNENAVFVLDLLAVDFP
jgi:hypothetical protein